VAITRGMKKYTDLRVPVLAIYAVPHATGQAVKDDKARAAADARDEESHEVQTDEVKDQRGMPKRIVYGTSVPHGRLEFNHFSNLENVCAGHPFPQLVLFPHGK
jgi:hypothetical protein